MWKNWLFKLPFADFMLSKTPKKVLKNLIKNFLELCTVVIHILASVFHKLAEAAGYSGGLLKIPRNLWKMVSHQVLVKLQTLKNPNFRKHFQCLQKKLRNLMLCNDPIKILENL